MGDLSPFHWLIISLVFVSIPVLIARTRKSRSFLVLRQFELRDNPRRPELPVVEIIGRHAGIIAFILSILRLANQSTFRVNSSCVEFESSSLFGQTKKFIPLSCVASMTGGIHKPLGYLIAAVVVFFLGIVGSLAFRSVIPLALMIIMAAVFVIGYFISKSILLEVTSNAGIEISIQFLPGVIEGKLIDSEKALATTNVICDLILMKQNEINKKSNKQNDISDETYPISRATSSMPPPFPERNASQNYATATVLDCEQEARELLRKAVLIYNSGQMDAAVAELKSIVLKYPSTKAALKSKEHLTKLGYH